ncbi:MAG: SCO family protein [Candidatus Binataceae bacterium]
MTRLKTYYRKLILNQGFVIPIALAAFIGIAAGGPAVCGCNSPESKSASDCLPQLALIDQNGKSVTLSSLKGKPVLVDFIYTSCPGPCLTITRSMERVAERLGPALGSQVTLVSISIDPEHEGPPQMQAYARAQSADRAGWLFLSGGPGDVDSALAAFNLKREREPDGSIEHLEDVILVGPDGRAIKEYKGDVLHPDSVLADIQKASG